MNEELAKLKEIRDSLIYKSKNRLSSHPGDKARIEEVETMIKSIESLEYNKQKIENFLKRYNV